MLNLDKIVCSQTTMRTAFSKIRSVFIVVLVFSIFTLLLTFYYKSPVKAAENLLPPTNEGRYLVKYKTDNSAKTFNSISKRDWKLVKVSSPAEFEKLRKDPNIEKIQPDFRRHLLTPDDSYYNSSNTIINGQFDQWNLRSIGLTPTSNPNSGWNITTGSSSTIVAVIDTGLALDNPDIGNGSNSSWAINNIFINQSEITGAIKAAIDTNSDGTVTSLEIINYFITNNLDKNSDGKINFADIVYTGSPLLNGVDNDSNGLTDDVIGYDFADITSNPQDHDGHGTHVSGVIGASTNNSSTVTTGIAGICWSCKIMPLRVVNDSGFAYDSDIVDAINYAVNKGAKVINMSLGGPGYSQPLQDAITNAWNNGVLVVSASGNFAASASDSYPGGSSSSLSVGAIDYLDQVAWYSNTGQKLDVVAPGDYVLSSYINSSNGCVGSGFYVCASGTSMASPHVAGLAALLFDLHKNDVTPWTAKQVRYALLQNTSELPTNQTSHVSCIINVGSFDDCSGFGKINSKNALLSSTMPADAVSPSASLNALASQVKGTINISGTASDANLYLYMISFERVSDGYTVKQVAGRSSITSNTLASFNTLNVADDIYILRLRVEDFAGNVTNASTAQFKVDNTAPSSFVPTSPANSSATNQIRPTFNWTASSDTNGVSYDVYVDGSSVTTGNNTTSYTLGIDLAEGTHTWTAIAKDPVGNTTGTSTNTFKEDRTPPNNYVVNVDTSSSSPTITFGATDTLSGIAGYQGSLDAGSFIAVGSPYNPGHLSNGNHSIAIRAFDNANNYREVTNNFTITSLLAKSDVSQIETIGPTKVIFQSVNGQDNGIYSRLSNDGVNWSSWTSSGAGDGNVTLVTFSSAAGNLTFQGIRGTDNGIYIRSSIDGVSWSNWQYSGAMTGNMSFAVFGAKLYQGIRGTDNHIYTRSSSNGSTWSNWIDSGACASDISFATFGSKLVQGVRGTDNKIYTRYTIDGNNWSNWVDSGAMLGNITFKVFSGKLYQSIRGTDNGIYLKSSADGINWSNWSYGGAAASDISLEAFGNRLFQALRGTDNKIYTRNSTDGTNWSNWEQSGEMVGNMSMVTMTTKAKLFQSVRGSDNLIYTRYNSGGNTWTNWSE